MSAPTDTKPNICERGPLNGQAFTTSLSPDTKQMAYTSYEKTTDTIKARGSYNKTNQ